MIDIVQALQRVQEDAPVSLVDENGQLTFLGCLFLLVVHQSVVEFFAKLTARSDKGGD